MAPPMKLLCVLVLFCLFNKGNCQCSLDNLSISQSPTGSRVGGKTEWRATIKNNCVCTQLSVKLNVNGFQTVEKVDPSVLAISGSVGLVNGGNPIFGSSSVTFTYAWDNPFPFRPLSSTIACS